MEKIKSIQVQCVDFIVDKVL